MNIGFDSKRFFHNRSGLGNYSRSTVRLLSHFYPDNKYYLFAGNPVQSLIPESDNVKVVEPLNSFSKRISGYWRSWGLKNEIKQVNLDIYHGLSNELPFNINSTTTKSVVTIHDLIFFRYPEYYPALDRAVYKFKFKHACRVANKIIAVSQATKDDIVSYFGTAPERIQVVYQSCDQVFKLPVAAEIKAEMRKKYNLPEQYILFLGTIEKRKNALTLIRALIENNIDFPLVIAGRSTDYINEIKSYLGKTSLSDRVIFRHTIESQDLPALYQSAIMFVYPSVFEGFGIPILEALNSGIPVITSTGSCFSETGGDAALYCDPYDVEQLGTCITKILNDKLLRESMTEKGYAHARQFGEEIVAANLISVYNGLM